MPSYQPTDPFQDGWKIRACQVDSVCASLKFAIKDRLCRLRPICFFWLFYHSCEGLLAVSQKEVAAYTSKHHDEKGEAAHDAKEC